MRRAAASLTVCLLLTGCALGPGPHASPQGSPGLSIHGAVHGGQQPIAGAHIYLLAANTTGYGGVGLAASALNASVSLLTSGDGTDSIGTYVLSNAYGNFTLSDYSCTPNTQVYLYALGGNPGAGINTAAGLIAIYGNCPAAGNFLTVVPFININEVTTVAAAYAFAGFATDATHVSSSGTALAQTGIANAFLNASNLANVSTGVALGITPAGNGTVPGEEINTLANVLAACINTTDAASPGCTTLLSTATSDGTPSGTYPTDTATAAINIAHNPTANTNTLYTLPQPASPFQPALMSGPYDFIVVISYTGGGLNIPYYVAIDGFGNAWFSNNGANSITEFSSTGVPLSPSAGFTGGGLTTPYGIAIDAQENVWVAGGSTVAEFSNSGLPLSPSGGYTGGGLDTAIGIAIDGAGAAWISNSGNSGISKFSSNGTAVSPSTGYTGGGLSSAYGIAIDGAGAVWATNFYNASVSKFSSNGTAVSPSNGYTGGGLGDPVTAAVDSSGTVWIGNLSSGSLTRLSNTGAALSPSGGIIGGGLYDPSDVAIDGAGNAWAVSADYQDISQVSAAGAILSPPGGNSLPPGVDQGELWGIALDGSGDVWITQPFPGVAPGVVYEYIGIAVPVITPIAAGLPATPTTDGSSNLGTRP